MQEVVSASGVVLSPPECCYLQENARSFWGVLVASKATRGWTESDLVMLVNLCNMLGDVKYWREQLQNCSPVIGEEDKQKPHPYIQMIDTAEKRSRMFHSHLQLHPQATQGPAKKQAEQNKLHSQSRDSLEESDDGLLAKPH
jgi:phage terminase small subunit